MCVFGLTGSGKSTTTRILREHLESAGLRVEIVKLAQPLYEIQQHFYRVAGIELGFYEQDQLLLESIATHLRRISASSLADDFLRRLTLTDADVVINDDLRDPHVDYPALRDAGFRFIRVVCDEKLRLERLKLRQDVTTVVNSTTTLGLDLIHPDLVVDNSFGDVDALRAELQHQLAHLR